MIVVEVVDGKVIIDVPRGPVAFCPRDVERPGHPLATASAAAIWDRGDW